MTFIPYEIDKLKINVKRIKLFKMLIDFQESDAECVEIVNYKHKNAKSCTESIRNAIKRYRLYTIQVHKQKERVFLYKDLD